MLHDLNKFKIIKDITLGYEIVYYPKHPNARKGSGIVYLHRLIMENLLDRYLSEDEIVHHKDENRSNNNPLNLELTTQSEHTRQHNTYLEIKICQVCKKEFKPDKNKRKYCSHECDQVGRKKIQWPSIEYLKEQLKIKSAVQLGKELGVSDVAIKKHIKKFDACKNE